MFTQEEFGRFLKMRRLELGLTQEAVSRQVGISHVSYQKYEKGISWPAFDRIAALANVLQVREFELFGFPKDSDMPAEIKRATMQEWLVKADDQEVVCLYEYFRLFTSTARIPRTPDKEDLFSLDNEEERKLYIKVLNDNPNSNAFQKAKAAVIALRNVKQGENETN